MVAQRMDWGLWLLGVAAGRPARMAWGLWLLGVAAGRPASTPSVLPSCRVTPQVINKGWL